MDADQDGNRMDPRRRAGRRAGRQLADDREAAWRLLTGATYDARQVQPSGEPALAEPLLRVRGIIV